jgi:hypothetical protein
MSNRKVQARERYANKIIIVLLLRFNLSNCTVFIPSNRHLSQKSLITIRHPVFCTQFIYINFVFTHCMTPHTNLFNIVCFYIFILCFFLSYHSHTLLASTNIVWHHFKILDFFIEIQLFSMIQNIIIITNKMGKYIHPEYR